MAGMSHTGKTGLRIEKMRHPEKWGEASAMTRPWERKAMNSQVFSRRRVGSAIDTRHLIEGFELERDHKDGMARLGDRSRGAGNHDVNSIPNG